MTRRTTGRWEARPRWRLVRCGEIAIGPGKADLLEAIGRHGSISAAAAALGMSYRRAWTLVRTMNRCFASPLVTTAGATGWRGQGASLTREGKQALRLYRRIERLSVESTRSAVAGMTRMLAR